MLLPSILKSGNEAAKSMRALPGEFNLAGYKSVSKVNNLAKITVGSQEDDSKQREILENLKTQRLSSPLKKPLEIPLLPNRLHGLVQNTHRSLSQKSLAVHYKSRKNDQVSGDPLHRSGLFGYGKKDQSEIF